MGWYQINLTYQLKKKILLVVRLARTGRRNQPKFRVVVAEHSKPIDGKVVEIVGHFDPAAPDKPFVVNKEAISKWIGQGAKPSNTVARLLNKYEGFSLPVEQHPPRKPKKEIKAKAAPQAPQAGGQAEAKPKPEAPKIEESKPEENQAQGAPVEAEALTKEAKEETPVEPEALKEESSAPEENQAQEPPVEAEETPVAETTESDSASNEAMPDKEKNE